MNEKLKQLIDEVEKYESQTLERETVLINLVEELLLTHCRENSLRNHNFKPILAEDFFLNQLAIAVRKIPSEKKDHPLSKAQRNALDILITAIKYSGKLARPHRSTFPASLYQDIYQEAINRTLLYVWQNIDKYDGNKGSVMAWINNKLGYVMLDVRSEFSSKDQQGDIPSLDELEEKAGKQVEHNPQNQEPDLLELLGEIISNDHEEIFTKKYVKDHPEITFQKIALAKFSGKSFREIAENFNIPLQTCQSFYKRSLTKFIPELKKLVQTNLEEQGYSLEDYGYFI